MESILSVIAIIISLITLCIQHYTGIKHNKMNLEGEMFRKIYLESITKDIPELRNKLQYAKKTKKINGIFDLQNKMNDIRFESLFYKYSDGPFFEKVSSKTSQIEDFLSGFLRRDISEAEYREFDEKLTEYLTVLYEIIMSKYSGNYNERKLIMKIRKVLIHILISIILLFCLKVKKVS